MRYFLIPNDIIEQNWDLLQHPENWKYVNYDLILHKIAPIANIIEKTATIPLHTLVKIISYIRTSENPDFSRKDMIDIFTYTEINRKHFFQDSFEDYNKKKETNTYNETNNKILNR